MDKHKISKLAALNEFLKIEIETSDERDGCFYREPYIPEDLNHFYKFSTLDHKVCSDCKFYLLGRMPDRICFLYKEKYMFSFGTTPSEEMFYTDKSTTIADDCDDFLLREIIID